MSVDDQIILPTWNDIRALDIKRTFLADGLYPEGELGQIFASAGVGKSTIEAQSCQAIGSGRRLWGRKTKQTHCGHYRS